MLRKAQLEQTNKRRALWEAQFKDIPFDHEREGNRELLPHHYDPLEDEKKKKEEDEERRIREEKKKAAERRR